MSDVFWLTDQQYERLQPLLPTDTRGVPRVDDRRVISGIVHVLRSGCRWKDAPRCYGAHKTLYNRFVRWAAKGVWDGVFTRLAAAGGPPAALMLDATHVKAHRSAAGGKGGPKARRSVAPAAAEQPRSTPPSMNADDHGGCSSVRATAAMPRSRQS
jgi:transposase